ncbi:uncharacterized protein LOC133189529 isoform X1 [Saccostrea echinata]|uniref:uncharacterized protein LOC133189529 isoform X1 n=1 Tax=Saccostrea echinata TaxID=191078 RepID=UPI002A8418FC|nr:uncharacterized protein LOC133189529 isoform X1 [Saccostrea echinata]
MSFTNDTRTIPAVSINIHSSTPFHGFKRIELAKRSRPKRKLKFNGQHFTLTPVKDCDEEMHFLKIITKNDQKRIHVYPSIKSKKKYRKRKDKKKLRQQYSIDPMIQIDEDDDYESEDEEMKEERKKSIQEKIANGKFLFTRKEEKDIHERAENFCRSVTADIYHFVKPGNSDLYCPEPCYVVNVDGSVKECPQPTKRKRGTYLMDSCYITNHDFHDPYDNTKMLPTGTRLLRPSRKLVEIVAKVLQDSPDGLLQVPQIYAALQNKYPYYRYMDKPSISSWRSSIRHALYQKWFKKVKFSVTQIRCKGSYWALNTDIDPPTLKQPDNERSPQSTKNNDSATEEHNPVPKRKRRSKKKKNEGMCRLQFKSNGELLEMKEDTKEAWNHNVTNSLQALLKVAKQYGLKISLTATPVGGDSDVRQSPVYQCDPILSSWPSACLTATGGPINSFCDSDLMYANYSPSAIDNQDFEKEFVSSPLLHNISPCFSSIDSCSNEASSSRCDYNVIPSFTGIPCSSLQHMHLSQNNSIHSQEMLGNMKTIFTDSETLYVNKNEDTMDSYIDEHFSLQELEDEENSETEELFSAVNSICENTDEYENNRLLEGDDILGESNILPNFCNIPPTSQYDDQRLSPFPNSGNDFTQDSSLDDFLNSVLRMGGNLADTTFNDEDQVEDDSLFDLSLINEDSFFQHCQLFDELDS